jgi:hypothetical protein
MKQTKSGAWVAEPFDTSDTVFAHWPDFVPATAVLNNEAGDQFMFGGVVLDDKGVGQGFDSFESVDDARTFCVEVLGVPAPRISMLEG